MGFMDIFLTVTKDGDKEAPPANAKGAVTTGAVAPAPVSAMVLPTAYTAGINTEMLAILNKAVEDANIEGFDYLEFREALAGYADLPMTEQQKYEAVYRTIKVMGVTLDKLLSSIDHYIGILGQQHTAFIANVDNAVKEQVESKVADIANDEQNIANALAEINRLNELVVKTQQEVLAKKNEVAQNQQQIDMTRSSFEATYNVVVGKLNEDKTKMTTFLKK
jgi:hypothetical protein